MPFKITEKERDTILKRFISLFLTLVLLLCLPTTTARATGNGNMNTGGGGMGQGTSQNKWIPGNDGVRITVIDTESGAAASIPMDFSNQAQTGGILHFGKVSKLQYRNGASLQLQTGGSYGCIQPANPMPTIVSSTGRNNIESIKRYFCSEYACMMVAEAAGMDYDTMISGRYKLMVEPIAYFTHNGQYYCMTATEAALYDQLSGGALRTTMPSLTHKNLPLSIFLEHSDLGIGAWAGNTTGTQSNTDIINSLGVGIIWFNDPPASDDPGGGSPGGGIALPDSDYRVDTDVITAITLYTDMDLTPDNPATVTFHILGTAYQVNNIVIPKDDCQLVWVKWHTPATPQNVNITVTVNRGTLSRDTITARIVDLSERIPPDPLATDTYPGYTVPPLPPNPEKLSANWGVWSCRWVPNWQWHADWKWHENMQWHSNMQWHATECTEACPRRCEGGHGEWRDEGEWQDDGQWVDEGEWEDDGEWEYSYTGYYASLSGTMALLPDDIVPTANGKDMKSGYGVKTEVRASLSTNATSGHCTTPQTALATFPEFQYKTYLRLLQRVSGGHNAKFTFRPNEFSTYRRNVHFTPVWMPDNTNYTVYTQVWDTWTPDGMLSVNVSDHTTIHQSVFDDWYTNRE